MAKGVSFNSSEYTSKYDPIFQGTDYWDTYQSIVNQYKDGVPYNWFRGFTGKHQTDVYNHKMAYSNALNALVEQMRADKYNSPANQAELEKQAGLNPDLTGVSGSGTSESAIVPNQTPMEFENPVPHLVSFLSMIGGAVAGAQSMISQKVVNDGLRLQNLEIADNIVLGELGRLNIDSDGADIMPAFTLGFSTGSRSMDKKLESRAKSLYDSISHKISSKGYERDLANIRKQTFDITSSAGYSNDDDFYQGLATRMADAYQKLIDMQMSVQRKEYKSRSDYLDNFDSGLSATTQNSENQSRSDYLDNFDPSLSASTDNEANKRSSNRDKQWNEFISIQHGVIGYIRSEAKKGNSDAIDLLFRIFGENVSTANVLSPIREIGLGLKSWPHEE